MPVDEEDMKKTSPRHCWRQQRTRGGSGGLSAYRNRDEDVAQVAL